MSGNTPVLVGGKFVVALDDKGTIGLLSREQYGRLMMGDVGHLPEAELRSAAEEYEQRQDEVAAAVHAAKRSGFTLIEILVVIGIILLLLGIVAVGLRGTGEGARGQQTSVVLENAKGFITELETTGGLSTQPPHIWSGGAPVLQPVPLDSSFDIWKDADPNTAGQQLLTPPGMVGKDAPSRLTSDAVRNTQIAMSLLAAVPNSRKVIDQLPPERTVKLLQVPATRYDETNPPVMLDAWDNPVIFVPSTGLAVVQSYAAGTQYRPGHYVNSGGTIYRCVSATNSAALTDTAYWEQTTVPTFRSPDQRPFFASAGPDGDFYGADDNVYSFAR